MATVRVELDEAALQAAILSQHGIIAEELGRRAVRVTSAAKQIATGAPHVQTGRYRASIAWRLAVDGQGVYAEVGSNVEYAVFIEEGTRPHVIRPRTKRALAWPGGRHPVKSVRHPGTRPYRVLQKALEAAL